MIFDLLRRISPDLEMKRTWNLVGVIVSTICRCWDSINSTFLKKVYFCTSLAFPLTQIKSRVKSNRTDLLFSLLWLKSRIMSDRKSFLTSMVASLGTDWRRRRAVTWNIPAGQKIDNSATVRKNCTLKSQRFIYLDSQLQLHLSLTDFQPPFFTTTLC